MKENLISYLRHAITAWIAAVVVYLTAKLTLDASATAAVEQALKQIGDGLLLLIITLAPILGRMAWAWIANGFRLGAGETNNSRSGGAALLILVSTTVALGALPSCTPEQLAAARAVPIRAKILTPGGAVSYSAKGGLTLEVDASSVK